MTSITETTEPESCCSAASREGDLISHCPMAAKFDQTFGSVKLKLSLCLIGVVLVFLGIAIILEPKIAAWLIALSTILMGTALLTLAYFINQMKSLHKS